MKKIALTLCAGLSWYACTYAQENNLFEAHHEQLYSIAEPGLGKQIIDINEFVGQVVDGARTIRDSPDEVNMPGKG